MARKARKIANFEYRRHPGTVLVFARPFRWLDEDYEIGDPIPQSLLDKPEKLRGQFLRGRIELWWAPDVPDHLRPADQDDPPPPSDPPPSDTDRQQGDPPPDDPPADDGPEVPEPVHQGSGWYRIEGVEGAFRGEDEARTAWLLENG